MEPTASPAGAAGEPKALVPQAQFEFGERNAGTVIEHDFMIRNDGTAPLSIQKVSMTTPLLVTQMPREIAAGSQAKIHFNLDTAYLTGKFDGAIVVFLNDKHLQQANLSFTGRIVPPIELLPISTFFVAGQRGRGGRAAIEIVNHEQEPLRIEKIEHATARFTTQLETVDPGQRFRLTLNLRPDGPAGKSQEMVLVTTSSKKMPSLQIEANTYLFERVHTFPEVVAFGTLRPTDTTEPDLTLMIYQEGGSDFLVKLSTDVPGLSLKCERGPKGDRYQASVALNPRNLPLGAIKGSIFVSTNDPQFPKVIVPVYGQIAQR